MDRHTLRLWARQPSGLVGLAILLLYLFLALFGPAIAGSSVSTLPANPQIYAPPSWAHPLGTDYEGVDVLMEIVDGAQPVLYAALLIALFSVGLGSLVGLLAGALGGLADVVLMRVTDLFLTLPSFPLLVVVTAALHLQSIPVIALVISLTAYGGLARSIRSQILSLRERDFVLAARCLDLGAWHLMMAEYLPNLMPYILVHLLIAITTGVYAQIGLFFLGVLPFRAQNWGMMLNIAFNQAGAIFTSRSVLYLLSPIAAVVLLQTGILLFSQSLDPVLNPRLRTS
jgi:peptide/nickel transport system permease protein